MRYHLLIFFSFAMVLCSCHSKFVEKPAPIQKIFKKHRQMQIKNRMKLVATGLSQDNGRIKGITLHYICFNKMQVPEARRTLIATIDSLLELIESDEELQNESLPITYQNIKLNIGFCTDSGKFQGPPNVAWMRLDSGTVYYCYHDPIFQHFTEMDNIQESYETSLAHVSEITSKQEMIIFKMQLKEILTLRGGI